MQKAWGLRPQAFARNVRLNPGRPHSVFPRAGRQPGCLPFIYEFALIVTGEA